MFLNLPVETVFVKQKQFRNLKTGQDTRAELAVSFENQEKQTILVLRSVQKKVTSNKFINRFFER